MTSESSASSAPLRGVRVLELSRGIAAQTAGMLLADLGAEVVRPIESLSQGPESIPGFVCWNRGKQLVHERAGAAQRALETQRLAERADVLLADPRPGELDRQGLDAATLAARSPGLVHVWMPPIAAGGRWSQLPHDVLLLEAVSGFAAQHPASEERPVASVVPGNLHLHGVMGAGAAVAGLLARVRDGRGRGAIVTGLQAVAASLCTLRARAIDGPPIISTGKALKGAPQFRLYRVRDGRWLFLAALSPELFYRALDVLDCMQVMAREDVAGEFINLIRPEVSASVGTELEAIFETRTVDEWLEAFREAGVPVGALASPADWLEGDVIADACPPIRRRHPALGDVTLPGIPVGFSSSRVEAGRLPELDGAAPMDSIWREVPAPEAPGTPIAEPDRLPLEGLRVLDLATFVAAPFVGSLLATHGAEVMKIESPAGDPYSVFTVPYATVNAHKRVLSLDLKSEVGRARLLELLGHADVCIDNLLPATLDRLGLAENAVAQANPKLIRCSVTAFGQTGRASRLPGFDPLMQAMSGLAAIQGGAGEPVVTSAPLHDMTTGAVGALGTLAALYVRETRGTSQRVFTSLAASSTLLQSGELTTWAGRPERAIGGFDHPGSDAFHRYYHAKDGWIAVAARTESERQALLEVSGDRALEGRSDGELQEALEVRFATRSGEAWVRALGAVGVPSCRVVERTDFDDAFLRDQAYSHVVDSVAVGRLEVLGGFTDWCNLSRRPPTPPEAFRIDIEQARSLLSEKTVAAPPRT